MKQYSLKKREINEYTNEGGVFSVDLNAYTECIYCKEMSFLKI